MEIKPATAAWAALGAGVLAYEILCPPGETLSEGVDRALEHPLGRVAALGGIALTAAHLANLLPKKLDPLSHLLFWKNTLGTVVDDAMDVWDD